MGLHHINPSFKDFRGIRMNVDYIVQPDTQLGRILSNLLNKLPSAPYIVFVSAFVALQTIMRVKQQIAELKENGTIVRFVIGIDLGGTSKEVLKELLAWGIDVQIVKHRIPMHTFHTKLYLFRWDDRAIIIIGSNNLTEGGFFRNYEGAALITYQFPDDLEKFNSACKELGRFLEPKGPVVYQLTDVFLDELIARGYVPSELEARKRREAIAESAGEEVDVDMDKKYVFGTEDIELPPPLPAEILERLVLAVRQRRKTAKATQKKTSKKKGKSELPIDDKVSDSLLPAAFYMTLPTLQGKNIPGEGRIPLEAIELAKDFWGWPDEYTMDVSPRKGDKRVYWNWRPNWRIWSVDSPQNVTTQEVRMYMYENSSDFRFYVRPLINAGANLGDLVRIRRIAQSDSEFECVLARQNTLEYQNWIRYCTQPVRNSTRSFGYA